MATKYDLLRVELEDTRLAVEVMKASKHPNAPKLLVKLEEKLAEIESAIDENRKEFELSELCASLSSSKNNPAELFASACKKAGIDYNCRMQADFTFSTGIAVLTVKPAVIRTSRQSVIRWNGKEIPMVLSVNLSDKKSEMREFTRTANFDGETDFASMESAFRSLLSCYGDLPKEYDLYSAKFAAEHGKKSRFESASAWQKLQRLTRSACSMSDFFEVIPTGTHGNATESASKELTDVN